MAWDEWEQLKAQAADRHSTRMQINLAGWKWGVNTWNGVPYDAGYIESIPSDESFGAHRVDVDTSGRSDYWN
ncbi:hypothetical protein ACGFW5_03615 [Streptomyces sp. NPDC048416]|uniref:hypothetical protein n=1 Tax=Streptomyces sp. NPDC048416 TaxID=3365546 RepID=UPI00371ECAEE